MTTFPILGKKDRLRLPGICAVLALMLVVVLSTAQAYPAQLSLSLAWQPGTGPISGYMVYYGVSSGKYTKSVDAGNNLSCTLQGLVDSTYYIAALDYDALGNKSSLSTPLIVHPMIASALTGGSITPSGTFFVMKGAAQTFSITPHPGYHVANVTVDRTSIGAVTSHTLSKITANHTIEAVFAIDTYTVTASAGANGSISPSVSLTYGAAHTFAITPRPGYHVATITVDGTTPVPAATSYTFSNVTASHTIEAAFAIDTYAITTSAGANGSISPSGSVSVTYGAAQTFTITPAANYKISGVTVDGKPVGAVSRFTLTRVRANHTVVAAFEPIIYKISASSRGGGSISPSGEVSVDSGTNPVFTITPDTDYQFAELLVDGRPTFAESSGESTLPASYTFTKVAANHTIQAIFRIPPPVADAGPDQDVTSGSTVTLNGSNSTDTVAGIASYRWIQTAGPHVKLISNPSVPGESTFTAPEITSGRLLSFMLVVTNKRGVTKSDSCLVNVSGSDDAPLANAGHGQTVSVPSLPPYTKVTLGGSYGPDGKIASYKWTQTEGPKVEILDANIADASFVPPDPGSLGVSLVFQLQVTDHFGLTTRDWCAVNVVNADKPDLPPVADAGAPSQTAATGSPITLDGSGSYDPGGSSVTYRWKQIRGVPVTFSDPSAATTVFTVPSTDGAESSDLMFMLTVTNANDTLSASAECVVTVEPQ